MHYKKTKFPTITSCKYIAILTIATANFLGNSHSIDAQNIEASKGQNDTWGKIFNKKISKNRPNWQEKITEYKADKAAGFDSAEPYWGKLVEVLDGNTIKALVDGVRVNIRTEYNDAPESDQPFGKESKDYLQKLIGPPGSEFYATPKPGKDNGREPAYNRPLARINNVHGQDVVTEMIRAGMSMPAFDDSSPMSDNLRNLGSQAGESELGIHQFTYRGSPNILPSTWRGFSQEQKAWHWKQREIAKTRRDPRDIPPQESPPKSTSLSPMTIGLGLVTVVGVAFALDRANNNRLARERRRKRHEEEDVST